MCVCVLCVCFVWWINVELIALGTLTTWISIKLLHRTNEKYIYKTRSENKVSHNSRQPLTSKIKTLNSHFAYIYVSTTIQQLFSVDVRTYILFYLSKIPKAKRKKKKKIKRIYESRMSIIIIIILNRILFSWSHSVEIVSVFGQHCRCFCCCIGTWPNLANKNGSH